MLIGEVSARSGVSARMLRHYDRIGLVSPTARTHGGYREYSEEDIRRLFHVEGLRSLGLALQEIADAFGDLSFSPAAMVDDLIARTHARLAQETKLLRDLSQVQASEPTGWFDVLKTIGLMRGLDAEDASERQRFALSLDKEEVARGVIPLVEAALTDTDLNAAGALDWALAQGGDAAVPILSDALDSPDERRRHRAVEALTKIGSPRASDALVDAFEHPDPLVRSRASLARGRRGDTDVIPTLVALIVDGRDDVEASDVLADLAARRGCAEEITSAIGTELARAGDTERQRLTAALADIRGQDADVLLTGLAGDPDRRVALTATFLLRSRDQSGVLQGDSSSLTVVRVRSGEDALRTSREKTR
ncbi:MAG TPA: MerR family transcriptional regulator [Agromyces sp.]|nr:MerR family transcriptional regulator [Agromyces sp.]